MNNEADLVNRNQEAKRELKPKLRFPEFRDAPEWEEKQLKDVTSSIFDGTHQTPTYTTEGVLFYSVENLISGNKNKFISHEDYAAATSKNKPEKDDILLTRIGKIGYSQVVTWDHEFSVYVTLAVIKKSKLFDSYYLHYFMQSERYQAELLKKSLLNAVPCKINMDSLKGTEVLLPEPGEQQKIADCLSSLDDRITAETQKLGTLKVHKKGLMQQLFPAEGETLPKLRFSEFRDAGKWEEDDLSKLSSWGLSNGIFNDPKKVGRGYKLINVLDMYIDTAINEENLSLVELSRDEFLRNKVEEGDLFFTRSSLVKSGIAYSKIYLGSSSNITFDGHLIRFRPNKEILMPIFINYLLRTNKVRSRLVSRGKTATMTTIGQADVGSVKLSFPHITEQQKIVDCLSSLDELITAQTRKIATLKVHKKGLMQQLFPALDEVTG